MNNDDIHALESIDKLQFYNSYVFEKILSKTTLNKVLDFGCGYGTLISYVKKKYNKEILGYDINENTRAVLKEKNIKHIYSLNEINEGFETIISSNVLEHIEDDHKTLDQLNRLLKNDGLLVLYLPCSMKIWSNLDSLVGHYRRYTKKELNKKLVNSNFQILSTEYVDSIGWIVLFLSRILKINLKYDTKKLIFYDRYVFKYLKFLDIFFKNLFGKNILVVAKRN